MHAAREEETLPEDAFVTVGIESSCDETAVAVLRDEDHLLANLVFSQAEIHAPFGGVVPEVASRDHLRKLPLLVVEALTCARTPAERVNLVACTYGPGLLGPLLVGLSYAKGFAAGLGVPLLGVNHLEGHLFAHRLSAPDADPPFMGLLVSGGHTALVVVPEYGQYQLIGSTVDDAAGEALDKVGKQLGIPYPAGAELERLSEGGDPSAIPFPRPMAGAPGFDFSFAGLKTAVMVYLRKHPHARREDVAASFLASVVDVLAAKSIEATRRHRLGRLVVAGGVAACRKLRRRLREDAAGHGIDVHFPPQSLCTDNAAMIAAAGVYRHRVLGETHPLTLAPSPRLSL
ncbi:MAG: tRNA (adenosine(37)-N6)-threonylcarbamoyltransferase complex transferase subunit TsaD [Candidatus Bipolaricaulota bacterium]|nr:MAG: tRNA (adenosine(37)-N6)-threonylcarbamoyltransferase complex transferase subunit TsaD [Candidatus Bipolaricaulota bacterium]